MSHSIVIFLDGPSNYDYYCYHSEYLVPRFYLKDKDPNKKRIKTDPCRIDRLKPNNKHGNYTSHK